jgi:hypothetical protein
LIERIKAVESQIKEKRLSIYKAKKTNTELKLALNHTVNVNSRLEASIASQFDTSKILIEESLMENYQDGS